MSGFTNFLGSVAGQVATRVILNRVMNPGGLGLKDTAQPGYQIPIQIPPGPDVEGSERDPASADLRRFQIPSWAFLVGYGGLLWYAAKATSPVDVPDLGETDLDLDGLGQDDLLFPGLRRELTDLDMEDLATSDDPVEACLERSGWKLNRIDALRQGIFEKEQTDLFSEPEPYTRSEEELLAAIETCMQRLESQYGSLEAAGVGCDLCSGDDPDLGAVQREMFDPEEQELTLYPGPTAPKHMQAKEGPLDFWFHVPKGKRKPRYISQDDITTDRYYYLTAEKEDRGKVYMIEANSRFDALRKLEAQLKASKDYAKEYGRKQNKFTPWFQPEGKAREGYRFIPNIMAHPK